MKRASHTKRRRGAKRTTKAHKTLRAKPAADPALTRAARLHNVLLFIADAHGEQFDVIALVDGLNDILDRIDWHAMPVKVIVEVISKLAENVSDDELIEMSAEASRHRDGMRTTIEDCRRDVAGIPSTPEGLLTSAAVAQ